MKTYKNPVIPGFYPDPSICRVGEDYYLVTSTFEYFPGLPVLHSRDLVHWRQIGHVLDRPSQLDLDGIKPSGGLYAPTIRYHDGTFYVINTHVRENEVHRNFIVTAADPAGPWSEPFWLDAPGIDPSLFFDDGGRAWYCGNRVPDDGEQFRGHREIWLQELDLGEMQLTGPAFSLWQGALNRAIHAEAPHIYKIDGLYYLLISEGGTAHDHAVTIARSESITGPYESNPRNPILTHRHLGYDFPISNTGHADLVETQNGEWWMVCLASRPYGGYYYNLGRETWLVPVTWEDGWPLACPGIGHIPFEHPAPDLPEQRWPAPSACDHFEGGTLGFQWNFIRTPREDFWSLSANPGHLRLRLRPERIIGRANPSFVGRRQQHIDFSASLALTFTPRSPSEIAGIVALQNPNFHYRLVLTLNDAQVPILRLVKREDGNEEVIKELPVDAGKLYLRVEAHGQDYRFYYAARLDDWQLIAAVDGRILSTPVAGGFVGAVIGMYASSKGEPSNNYADFDWFEYTGL